MMNRKEYERERSRPNVRHCPGICLEGVRKTMKNLGQDSRHSDQDLNPGPPEHEAGVLTIRPRRPVTLSILSDREVLVGRLGGW
jgi:hypothetical protein